MKTPTTQMIGIMILTFFNFDPKEYDCKTEATIVDFGYRTSVGVEDDNETYCIVDYEVNGKAYKNVELDTYNAFMDVGDKVTIYYKSTDPGQITPTGKDIIPYVAIAAVGVGIIAIIIGFKRLS